MRMLIACFLVLFMVARGDYCDSGPTTTTDSTLGPVSIEGVQGSLINDTTGCPAIIGVQNLTSEVVILDSSKTWTIVFNATTCGATFGVTTGVWIDWNFNEVYESNEVVCAISGYGWQKCSFDLPLYVQPGATRMRVQTQENQLPPLDPCRNFPYGGTKDFTVVVSNPELYCTLCGPTSVQWQNLDYVTSYGLNYYFDDQSSCGGAGVMDMSHLRFDLKPGDTTPRTINYLTLPCDVSDTNASATGIWADLNRDGEFELLATASGGELITATLTIPATALPGTTRMRIQSQENGDMSALNPCSEFEGGGTKDFSLYIYGPNPEYCLSGPQRNTTAMGSITLKGDTTLISPNCLSLSGVQFMNKSSVELTPNQTYSWTYSTCDAGVDGTLALWVDWDGDSFYDNDWELANGINLNANNVYYSGNFTVPVNATPGVTRMRLQLITGPPMPFRSCGVFDFGGSQEFAVLVKSLGSGYCTPGPLFLQDTALGATTLEGDSRSIFDDTLCPNNNGIRDLLFLSADLKQKNSYAMSVTTSTCGQRYNASTAVWIDWNQNQVFETSELVFSTTGYAQFNFSVTVPSDAKTGDTRMRVQAQEFQPLPLDPCKSFQFGSTKDFTVNVSASSSGLAGWKIGLIAAGGVVFLAIAVGFIYISIKKRSTEGSGDGERLLPEE